MNLNKPEVLSRHHAERAYALLRVILGINIAIHGISRIVGGPAAFASALVPLFAKTPLPSGMVYGYALALPWMEALVGLIVLGGVFSVSAYTAGMILMATLTFGSALRQDWESAGLQLIYAVIYAGLLSFIPLNRVSFDGILRARSLRAQSEII
ncbi:MAG: DoxX family protein [Acidobacteriaceae bacterium]|nr:DoxX family protein [Acidobacteriaceae bacterium]